MTKTVQITVELTIDTIELKAPLADQYTEAAAAWFARNLNGVGVKSALSRVSVLEQNTPEERRSQTLLEQKREPRVSVGACVSFIIEKAPRGSLRHSGQRHAGYVKAVRGERVTVEDESGFRYTVNASSCKV
jgi:hypothetical protein